MFTMSAWYVVPDTVRLIEAGSPEDLKQSGGLYQKIYEIQSGKDGKGAAYAGK